MTGQLSALELETFRNIAERQAWHPRCCLWRQGAMRRWGLVFIAAVLSGAGWSLAWRLATFSVTLAGEYDRVSRLSGIAARPQATQVFDRHGVPAFSYFVERRIDVPLARVSPSVIDAIVAVEDRRFHRHRGVDPIGIARATWANVRAGRIVQGASTITQQLARAEQLTPARTYRRKLREVLLAASLEARYSKAQILEEYLNTVYFGDGCYGVEAAARGYFSKPAADLTLPEAALLAALVRSPSADAPDVAPARAQKRRNLVLALMRQQGRISAADEQAAASVPLPGPTRPDARPDVVRGDGIGLYFQEEVRRRLVHLFGSDRVLRGGLRVHSTYDPGLQREAEAAIASRIEEIAKGRRSARDLQGSLIAMHPVTGEIYALVGGRSFAESRFNRATQARRQAGSAFKPIIFAAALERGYAPGTLLRDLDTPIAAAEGDWLPAGEHEEAEYTLRRALRVSSNRASVQLLRQLGASTTVYYAQRLGITSQLPAVPSLALGTGEVTLLELATAYTAFANDGFVVRPRLIARVDDAAGRTIWQAEEYRVQALSARTAYLMSSMLSDVITSGTGSRARRAGFTLPAGGKTGTTDDYADAWFIGYTPTLLTGVWFGLDTPAPIMREGVAGSVAVPAWARFMRAATQGSKPEWFRMPSDVEKVAVCRLSGMRAGPGCREGAAPAVPDPPLAPVPLLPTEPMVYEDLFPAGAIADEICTLHHPPLASAALASSERIGSRPR